MGINLNDLGYQDTRAAVKGSYELLRPDAYICVIVNAKFATSQAGNQMLVLFIDIAEGEYSGYFRRFVDSTSERGWAKQGTCRQVITGYNGRLSPHFKGLLSCVEMSNPSYHVNADNFDPSELIGKWCGFVFGEEEYLNKRDNSIGKNIYIAQPISVIDVANGNYKIPELKKLPAQDKPQPQTQPTKKSADDYYFNGSGIDPEDTPF